MSNERWPRTERTRTNSGEHSRSRFQAVSTPSLKTATGTDLLKLRVVDDSSADPGLLEARFWAALGINCHRFAFIIDLLFVHHLTVQKHIFAVTHHPMKTILSTS